MSNVAFRRSRINRVIEKKAISEDVSVNKGDLVQVINVGKGTIRCKPVKTPDYVVDFEVADLEHLTKEENELANLLFG
jgi:hypothetical protein